MLLQTTYVLQILHLLQMYCKHLFKSFLFQNISITCVIRALYIALYIMRVICVIYLLRKPFSDTFIESIAYRRIKLFFAFKPHTLMIGNTEKLLACVIVCK